MRALKLRKGIAGGTINGQDHIRPPTEARSNSGPVLATLERGDAHRYRSEASGVNQMGSKPRRISAGRLRATGLGNFGLRATKR